MLAFLHRGTCFLKGLPASPLTLRPSFYTAVGVIFPKRKLGHNPSLLKTHYGFPWNLKKKKKIQTLYHVIQNPNSITCPSGKTLGKGIPSCGLTAATQTEQFGNCEPLCSAQPLQLYWDALHEALSDPGPTLFKLKLFLPLCHLSYLSHTALSNSILKYAKLFCLWPLPILFPLPGRVLVRLMPPTSDLLNITSLRKRDFPDLIKSSSLSPLLFILRPLFFFSL